MVEEDEVADCREGFPESTPDLINTMKMQVLLTAVAFVGAAMPVLADKLNVGVTDKHPGEHVEEKPAGGAVPQKVVDDCLAALRKQIGDKKMKVISKKRGEASFIVDVQAEGVEKPWRCFHDGSKCTGTEYQGEG